MRNSVSLVMLPIYTRYLLPEDYGVIELLIMIMDFVGIILGSRIGEAIFRYYSEAENDEIKNTVISTSLLISGLISCFGYLMIFIFATQISFFVLGSIEYDKFIILFSITLITQAFIVIPLSYIRAEQKAWLYLIINFLGLTLQVSLNIYFVVINEMHVEGVIYSALIASIIMAVILTYYTLYRVGFGVSINMANKLISFSIPITLATVGTFYLTYGDRYFLRTYVDLNAVGIYSLGYKFGFILAMLAWDPFSKIWDSEKYEIYKKENAIELYQSTFFIISLILIFVALCIAIYVKDLLRVMSDVKFWTAYEIVPVILTSYVIWAWTKFCSLGILLEKKTIQLMYAETFAVIVITIAYLLLIPLYGGIGAAYATLIGFLARFCWVYYKSKGYYDMKLEWNRIYYLIASSLIIYFISTIAPDDIVESIIYRTFLILIFITTIFILPILSKSEKKTVISFIFNKLHIR